MEGRVGGDGGRGEGGGAGGKLSRRSLARKTPAAAPYDRPRPPQRRGWRQGDEEGEGGWFSKARLSLSPASRLLPSFFSSFAASASSPSSRDPVPRASSGSPLDVEQDSDVDTTKPVCKIQASDLNETVSSGRYDHLKHHLKTDECAECRFKNTYGGIGGADIEQRLKQKTFSRDESNRLIELLRSRTADLAKDDTSGVRFPALESENAWDQKDTRESFEEKNPVLMNVRIHKEKKRSSTPHDGQPAVLPILGLQLKNMKMSGSKCATPYDSANFGSSFSAKSVLHSSASIIERNLWPNSSKCNVVKHQAAFTGNDSLKTDTGLLRVHPKSSEVARKIFEHLDRTVPSPQDKPPEPKRLIQKKILPQSGVIKMLNDQDYQPCPASHSTSILQGAGVIKGNAEVQKPSVDHPQARKGGILDFNTGVTYSAGPQTQNSQPLCQYFGSGRVPTIISTSKLDESSCLPDNGFGLSFPALAASDASCEHLLVSILAQHSSAGKEENIPSFSFGSSAVGSGPIFCFGPVCNSISTTFVDSSIPRYRFGSDDGSRFSFRPFVTPIGH